jgi:hypothetical protein
MYINVSYINMCRLNKNREWRKECERGVSGDDVCDCSFGELLDKKPFWPHYIFKHVLKNNFILFIWECMNCSVHMRVYEPFCSYESVWTVLFIWECMKHSIHMRVYEPFCSYESVWTVLFIWECMNRSVHMRVYEPFCSYESVCTVLFIWECMNRSVHMRVYAFKLIKWVHQMFQGFQYFSSLQAVLIINI